MKDSIIVKVSDLRSVIQDIRRKDCDLVSLTINEADESDGEVIPACISFSGCRISSTDEWIEFEQEVEAVPNESALEEKMYTGIFMSDNLI